MSIDEAIEKSKELASTYRIAAKNAENIFISKLMQETKRKIYIKLAEEHEQLAEWLEELKELRATSFGYRKEDIELNRTAMYNKAIDDFANVLKENYDYLPQILSQESFGLYIDEYAERLKEGEIE